MLPNGNQYPQQQPPLQQQQHHPQPPPLQGAAAGNGLPSVGGGVVNTNYPQHHPQSQQQPGGVVNYNNYAHQRPHQPFGAVGQSQPQPPLPGVAPVPGQVLRPPSLYNNQPQQQQPPPPASMYPNVQQSSNLYPRVPAPPPQGISSIVPPPGQGQVGQQGYPPAAVLGYPQTHQPLQQPPSYYPQQQQPQHQQQQNSYPNNVGGPQQQQMKYPNYPVQNGVAENYNNGGVVQDLSNQMGGLSVTQQGFNKLWGIDHVDLLKVRHILPPAGVKPPEVRHSNEYWKDKNVAPDLFRCTLTKIPETKSLLQKSRLPLGILIHPFKDLTVKAWAKNLDKEQLPVIQCSTIVRCRSCRTYINPFVYFVDTRRWKCNLCFRVNDLPEEFQYDPLTKTYGDPTRRPEVRSGTIEFLAPADYMVRPPQAAVYLFVLESTSTAIDTGYLKIICDCLLESLDTLPGDSRTQIGFITFNSSVQFYNLSKEYSQPCQMSVCDIDDVFVPCPEGLVVSLSECKENVRALLTALPSMFLNSSADNRSCLGAAVQIAQKMLSPIGGRITVFQATLPVIGPGSLPMRAAENRTIKDLHKDLNPATDFYKKLALDCSSQYIAVDVFFINDQYADIASVSCISKYSGGSLYKFSNLHSPNQKLLLENGFMRYLTRKIGFEAVMRVRCSRGMSIHTFHGNLFVRSTDLLSLPNCNPDAGFGMQVSIDEDLRDFQTVCFQAALLYTSSKGERRIRVHTLCLPVGSNVNDIIQSADQQCIIGLLAKMGVDRSLSSSLTDAREAFVNAVVDILSAYLTTQNATPSGLTLIAPQVLQMLPTYIQALLRSMGFRSDSKPSLDERTHFMNQMKSLPLTYLIQSIYPDLYPIHQVLHVPSLHVATSSNHEDDDEDEQHNQDEHNQIPQFPLLSLSSDRIEANGVYILDQPELILVYVNRSVSQQFCKDVLGVDCFQHLNEMNEFPEIESVSSIRIRNFVQYLQSIKPFPVPVRIIREDSRERNLFVWSLIEDRGDPNNSTGGTIPSYYEFLQQIKNLVK